MKLNGSLIFILKHRGQKASPMKHVCYFSTKSNMQVGRGVIEVSKVGHWLSSRVFIPIPRVPRYLFLSGYIVSICFGAGLERLSSLKKLEVLDLSGIHDTDNILPSLRTMSSLKILDLSNTGLTGIFPTNGTF
ncbi:hypothetical protein LXL04_032051 [Taraxacum kok-saghyz]